MTEEEIALIHGKVQDFLDGPKGAGFDIGKSEHFEKLVASVTNPPKSPPAKPPENPTGDPPGDTPSDPPYDLEIRIVVALSVLGPGSAPPRELCLDFQQMLQTSFPDATEQQQRLMEIGAVYGSVDQCRGIPVPLGWEVPWQGSLRLLTRAIEPRVHKARGWLRRHVPGFPNVYANPNNPRQGPQSIPGKDAHTLTLRLVEPEKMFLLSPSAVVRIACDGQAEGSVTTLTHEDGDDRSSKLVIPLGAKTVWRVDDEATLTIPSTKGEKHVVLQPGTVCIMFAREEETHLRIRKGDQKTTYKVRRRQEASLLGPTTLAIFACACGHSQCAKRHRLAAWTPTLGTELSPARLINLPSFVSSAATGPNVSMQTGSFQQGLYFPLLANEKGADLNVRVIAAKVEYKQCQTPSCCDTPSRGRYEGDTCRICDKAFDPSKVPVNDREVLIVVDRDPPVYELTKRCRCTQCENLFVLTEEEVVSRARCYSCHQPLFERKVLLNLWKGVTSLLLRTRRLEEACRELATCPHCDAPVVAYCWCPLCRQDVARSQSDCLPKRMTSVWVRTNAVVESLQDKLGSGNSGGGSSGDDMDDEETTEDESDLPDESDDDSSGDDDEEDDDND